jgi:hypothetical protein
MLDGSDVERRRDGAHNHSERGLLQSRWMLDGSDVERSSRWMLDGSDVGPSNGRGQRKRMLDGSDVERARERRGGPP